MLVSVKLLVLVHAFLAAASPVLHVGTIHKDAAPVISSTNAETIPDSYIVVFKKHVTHDVALNHHTWVKSLNTEDDTSDDIRLDLRKRSLMGEMYRGMTGAFNIAGNVLGYTGHFHEDALEAIRRHPDVDYIEKDFKVHTWSDDDDDGKLENNAPWGLARISHRDSLSFGTFNKYLYSDQGGKGVDVYVIDTGTNVDHVDFEGRAKWGKTVPADDEDKDGNGHGTHCSGTIAGKKYGVAKQANVYAVKVLRSNGSGSMSDVVKGVEFAVESHLKKVEAAKKGKDKKFKGSTANMSLGGGKSTTLDLAVNAAVDAGIHFAVAAGNDNADSCSYSPAAAEKAVTVGASTLSDERAYFSNYGSCNDIFAPGLDILSTWIGSKYATNTISGTSMASPHIAGLLAYLLSLQPDSDSAYAVADITPKKLKKHLITVSTKGALENVGANTENLLAWNGGGSSNYSKIIEKGGYTVQRENTMNILPVDELKGAIIEVDTVVVETAGEIKEKAIEEAGEVKDQIKKISHHVEKIVFDPLSKFKDQLEELDVEVSRIATN